MVPVAVEEQTATDLGSLCTIFFYIAIVQGGTRQGTVSGRCCRDGSRPVSTRWCAGCEAAAIGSDGFLDRERLMLAERRGPAHQFESNQGGQDGYCLVKLRSKLRCC